MTTPLTYEQVLAKATPARRTVHLHLDGALLAERDRLEHTLNEYARLARLQARDGDTDPETSLADTDPLEDLRDELADVLERLRSSEVPFTFKALPMSRWDALRKAHEIEGGKIDLDTITVPLVAQSAVQPPMGEDEVTGLFEVLNNKQRQDLFGCAWAVNTGEVDVPFSPASSVAEKARRSAKS